MPHFLKVEPDESVYIVSLNALIKMRFNGPTMTVDYCIDSNVPINSMAEAEFVEVKMLEKSLGMLNEDLGGVS